MVRDVYRFHVYYHVRRVLKRLQVPLQHEASFNAADNPYTKEEFCKICEDYGVPHDPVRYRDEKLCWTYQCGVVWPNDYIGPDSMTRWITEKAQGFTNQAISGENFSQSEYVAFSAISQVAFPPLAKAIHRAFDYVNLSNLCSKQVFHSINLSNIGFIIESQSVRIHISFWQKPINKLRFEAENSTDPMPLHASIEIAWMWCCLEYQRALGLMHI